MTPYYVNASYLCRKKILANSPCEAACKIAFKYPHLFRSQEPMIYVDERGYRGVIGIDDLFDNDTSMYSVDFILQSIKGVHFE